MGRYKFQRHVYETCSIKGVINNPVEPCKAPVYYFVKIRSGDNVFYYGDNGILTELTSATPLSKKDAAKIANSIRKQYDEVDIFTTTKNE